MLSTELASDDVAAENLKSDGATSGGGHPKKEKYIRLRGNADLVLDVQFSWWDEHLLYLVITKELRESSPYFHNLLDPEKFSEGARVNTAQSSLRDRFRSWDDVAPSDLPHISIVDIGPLSSRVRQEESMTTFFNLLLGVHPDVNQATPSWLVNLVVIADRFNALHKIKEFVAKHHRIYTVFSTKWIDSAYKEEPTRQILLIGMRLHIAAWITSCSALLILHGSRRWDFTTEGVTEGQKGLWWSLPGGLEEELIYRRESILDTLNSIQEYFLQAYTSRERQCKLGYDSSPQCDSFQLGEAVRFCTRVGTLRLQGLIYDCSDPKPFIGSVYKVVDKIRQCPSYQINKHHSHCGLRTRLGPPMTVFLRIFEMETGVCGECWVRGKAGLMWSEHPRVKHWACVPLKVIPRNKCGQHEKVREMCTAQDRDWEPHGH